MSRAAAARGDLRWAVRGKRPGQLDDYEILADDSGGARRDEYANMMRELVAGNPPTTQPGAPDALPWLAFAAMTSASHGARYAFAVLEWPDEQVRDSTGRLATRCRYYDLDFDHTLNVGASYTGLYRALDGLGVPAGRFGPPTLETADLDATAAFIDRNEGHWLLAAATALIEGPVVLTGDNVPAAVTDRLRVLDAIAALLPYGYRADLPVATWAPNRAPHGLRLFFSDFVNRGQRRIRVGVDEAVTFTDQVTADYFDRLVRLRRLLGTAALLRELAADRREYHFNGSGTVLAGLERLDLPYALAIRAARDEPVLGEVRKLFRDGQHRDFDQPTTITLASHLIHHGVDADLRLLSPYWSDAVCRLLAETFISSATHARAQACVETADGAGQTDQMLCQVAALAPRHPDILSHVASLIGGVVPHDLPQLRTVLCNDPQLAALILIWGYVEGNTGGRWLELLTRPTSAGLAPWLKAFAEARTGSAKHAVLDVVDPVRAQSGVVLVALLAVALFSGRPDYALASKPAWGSLAIVLHGSTDAKMIELFHRVVLRHTMRPVQLAAIDLLLLLSGAQPRVSPANLSGSDRRSYLDGVKPRFGQLSERGVRDCLDGYATVVSARGGLNQAGLDFMLRLVLLVPYPLAIDAAYARIGDLAAANPSCLEGRSASEIRNLADRSGILRQTLRSNQIATVAARAEVPCEDLTELCLQAMDEGLPVAHVLEQLRSWRGMADPVEAWLLIEAMARHAGQRGPGRQRDTFEMGVRFMESGACGEAATVNWRRWLVRHINDQEQEVKWLKAIRKSGRPGVASWLGFGRGEK